MEFEKIAEIVSVQLNIPVQEIKEDTAFEDDLNADSLDLYQIIMALEEEFDMEFQNDDVSKIVTVGDAARYIQHAKE